MAKEEFDVIKTHTGIGYETLKKVYEQYPKNSFIKMGLMLTKHHHEKWNGKGYPDGLTKDHVPLSARIMAVVDVYDALRSSRPYKDGFSHEKTVGIIRKDSGIAFDPEIVSTFLKIEQEFAHIFESMSASN